MKVIINKTYLHPEYAPEWERPMISKLIDLCLEAGGSVTVHDSEEFILEKCSDKLEIITNLATSGEDTISVHDKAGECYGWFLLIYNNGSEGDPMIVIADHSDNEACGAIWNKLNDEFGE